MKNILLVEDDSLAIDYLSSILHPAGYDVITARNEFDALDTLSGNLHEIHLIIAETGIHSQNAGNHFLKNVKLMAHHSHTPFIFLTSKADYEGLQESIFLGADDVIVKPIEEELFITKINNLLNHYHDFSASQKKVHHSAQLEDPINIISMSDLGVILSMPFAVKEGAKIKISSDIFKDIGIANPYLKVIKVYADPHISEHFLVEATFLAETRDIASKLRKWQTSQSKKIKSSDQNSYAIIR